MSGGTTAMAWVFGLTFLLCALHMAKGATKQCTLSEIVTVGNQVTFMTGKTTTKTFTVESINGVPTLKIADSSGEISQQESCDVILQNNQPAEVIMSFRVVGGGSQRYCWKGILRNYVLFYVEGPKMTSSTGFTTQQCLSQLSSTTFYRTMMKTPLPDNNLATPQFGVSITPVIQPGTYKLSYAFDTQKQKCLDNDITQSSVLVKSDSVTFKPCGNEVTSYRTPFRKELYVAGYVEDSMLDIIKDGGQVGGAFVLLVYHEVGQPFRYYLMRMFQAVSASMQQENYLEIFGVTTEADAYSPTGFVDLRYVPSATVNDVLTLHAYSETCNSNPCKNGGTCVNQWLKFSCICPTGFAGETCQTLDDECSRNDKNGSLCSYHGTCIPTTNSYTCKCNDGYTGPKCQDTTTCRSDTCKNGGTCYDPKINSLAVCECLPGFYGIHCEDTKTCKNLKPCKNGGTCFDGKNGEYSCLCPDGYSGKNCDGSGAASPAPLICIEGIDDICRNGGVCTDGKCVCQAYYTGRYCEDINDWFIGSVVLIVLLAVVMVVSLIVCCFFCARGTTLASDGTEKSYDPFMTGSQDVARSTSGYGPDGFTANRYPDPSFYGDGYTSKF